MVLATVGCGLNLTPIAPLVSGMLFPGSPLLPSFDDAVTLLIEAKSVGSLPLRIMLLPLGLPLGPLEPLLPMPTSGLSLACRLDDARFSAVSSAEVSSHGQIFSSPCVDANAGCRFLKSSCNNKVLKRG